ncbi:RNA-binding domain-containing protein [Robbsia andropogonis]|uniref:RNA-binding domain-containing protein n=1 Tax=Robbsia andropogonis TaxID=28092 RepID=UPI0004635E44|nr:RNA-binding domain-containing protein [Robbsia andropogonis]
MLRKPIESIISKAVAQAFPVGDQVHEFRQTVVEAKWAAHPVARAIHTTEDKCPEPVAQDWKIRDVKQAISEFAQQGRLSKDVLDAICLDGACAPVEFELLDYKESFDTSSYGKGKLILRIVSFYNSFGGYLVFGVCETESEVQFDVVGFDPATLDIEGLKASIKEYTGERVQITAMPIETRKSDGTSATVLLLHIPQRPSGVPPLHFLKDGPVSEKKRPIFSKDSVYCRRGDECVEAKGPRILELNGKRQNPYLQAEMQPLTGLFRVNRLSHNLPDRNFICPRFIGRDGIVNALWRWLGDDLSHVKVLAGEGGLGKSSIAFEFAERVSETPDVPFEQVMWLTAKERQFKAFEDQYVKMPERHYTSYAELLLAICGRLPFTAAELDGATSSELRRMVKQGLAHTTSLVVIDDVDSLSAEEQRQVLELGMMLGGSASRFILTTRFNQSFSNDNVIKLSGLTLTDEFPRYIEALRDRLDFPKLTAQEIDKIHQTSDGSPLFSESLLRLLRWYTVNEAIAQWKGERGASVRAAALKREIELLSPEAQRILIAVALLGEASTVELCEILVYPSELIETGLVELQSLFLVAAPALASVARFRVPDNTRRLVVDPATNLVIDRSRLEKDIAAFRKKAERAPTRDSRVAGAISQAAALVRIGDLPLALATIKDARKRTQDHYDLLSYQAALHLKELPPQINQARTLARKAFTAGCRKPEVFESWFEAEWDAENYIGALEAAEAALLNKSPGSQDWAVRKSAALASKAASQAKAGSLNGAIGTMHEASEALRIATTQYRGDDASDLETRRCDMHDQMWLWTGVHEEGLGKTTAQLDTLEDLLRLGDLRITNARRVLSAIEGMAITIDRRLHHMTSAQRELSGRLMLRAQNLFVARHEKLPNDKRFKAIQSAWENLRTRIDEAVSRKEADRESRRGG